MKIHNLDQEDKSLLEDELGGILRAIEFIYKESGVNRPLKPTDDKKDNLNKTYYRDQINKVANAVKEIIAGLKSNPTALPEEKSQQSESLGEVKKEVVKSRDDKPKNRKARIGIVSLIALTLIVMGYFLILKPSKSQEPFEKSIAVLPFKLLSDEPDKQYLADGMMDAILLHLQKFRDFRVMSRTSVEQYRVTTKTTRVIGKELNVEYLLEGSFQKNGDNVMVIVQLVKADEERQSWANEYNRNWKDIFSVQSEIAQTIARELHAEISPADKQIIEKVPTSNLEAYDAFLKGQFFYEKILTNPLIENEKAMFWFKESIRLDSTFALPWTYLSMCYILSYSWNPDFKEVGLNEARSAAERALALDPNSGTAQVNMAEILDTEYDFAGAEEKINLALKLDPNNPYILRNAGRFYTLLGRGDESISLCNRALQNDPNNGRTLFYLTYAYYYAGRFTEARATLKKFRELGYQGMTKMYYGMLLEAGQFDRVLKEPEMVEIGLYNYRGASLAAAYFKMGNKNMAEKICDSLIQENIPAYTIAFAYAYGDEPVKAVEWLERSYSQKERGLTFLKVEPAFKKIRNEPGVKILLQKMKFPD